MAFKITVFACLAVAASGYRLRRDSPIPQGANPAEYLGQFENMGSGFYPSGLPNPSSLYGGSSTGAESAAAPSPSKRASPIPQGANPAEYLGQFENMGSGYYPSGLPNPSSLYGGSSSGSESAAAPSPSKRDSPIPQGANPAEYLGQFENMGSGFYPSGLPNPSSLYGGSSSGAESAAAPSPSKRASPIPQGANPAEYLGQFENMGSGYYPSGLPNPSSLYGGSSTGAESAAAPSPSKRDSPIPQGANPAEYLGQFENMGSGFYPSGLPNPSSLYGGSSSGAESAAAPSPSKRDSPIPQGANPAEYLGQFENMGSGFYPSGLPNPSSLYGGSSSGSESAAAPSPSKRDSPIPQGANPAEYLGQFENMGSGFYPSGLPNPSSLYGGSSSGSESAAAASPSKRDSPIPQGANPAEYLGQFENMGSGFYPSGLPNPSSLYGGSSSGSESAAASSE